MRRLRWIVPLFLALLAGGAAAATLDQQRASVVIHFPNGRLESRQVSFDTPLTGLDLLRHSGLPVESLASGAVCRIDGVGCPPTDCFCQCAGAGPCRFWSYWRWDGVAWQSSPVGAGSVTIADGDRDGWRWGDGPPTTVDGHSPSLTPPQQAAYAAAAWLRGQQRPDGSFTDGAFSVGIALDSVLAGAAADAAPHTWRALGGANALAYLAAVGPAYIDRGTARELGKLIAGVVALEGNPYTFAGRDLVAELDLKFDGQRFGEFNWDQAWALLALRATGEPIPQATVDSLLAGAESGGGWAFASGMLADVDSTGLVLQALAAAGAPPTSTAISAAIAYLHGQQNEDGGFPATRGSGTTPNPSNAPSTGMAVLGLVAIGQNPLAAEWRRAGGSPVDALLRFQNATGGLAGTSGDNDAQATAQAIPALMGKPYPIPGRRMAAERAARWLRAQQDVSGQFGFGAGSTTDALFAIAALGQDPATWRRAGGQSPLDYLATQADAYSAAGAAQTAKLIVGLNAVGVDPRGFGGVDLPARLASFDTGDGTYGGPTAQAWATLALRVLGQPGGAAAATLRSQQRADGGWALDAGSNPDTNTTALAVQALVSAGEALDSPAVLSATAYLRQRQALTSGFPYQGSDAPDVNSTALVVQALTALQADPDGLGWTTHLTATDAITLTTRTPVDWLLAQQAPSGAFPFFGADSDFATLQAIPALLDRPLPIVLRRLYLPLIRRVGIAQPR